MEKAHNTKTLPAIQTKENKLPIPSQTIDKKIPLVWGGAREASKQVGELIDLLSVTLDFQIERWWKELHERLEKYFKGKLIWLKNEHHYNPHDATDRYVKMGCFCRHK